MKHDMAANLAKTVDAEQQAVIDRFKKADQALEEPGKPRATPKPSSKRIPTKKKPRKSAITSVRRKETFSLPTEDHELLNAIRQRSAAQGNFLNRSEVVRVALQVLNEQTDSLLARFAADLPKLKPGPRPQK